MTLPIDAFDFFFFFTIFQASQFHLTWRENILFYLFIYLFIFSFAGSFEDLLKLDEERSKYGFLHKIYILRTSQTWFQLAML